MITNAAPVIARSSADAEITDAANTPDTEIMCHVHITAPPRGRPPRLLEQRYHGAEGHSELARDLRAMLVEAHPDLPIEIEFPVTRH